LLVWRSSARIWADPHEKAFRRLGACPRVVVLDNLKEGVAVPDIYDPTVNPLFRDVLAHYGVVALPCRILSAAPTPSVTLCALQNCTFRLGLHKELTASAVIAKNVESLSLSRARPQRSAHGAQR
jgi:hypothetical protein